MTFCSQCGERLPSDAVFCTACGKPVEKPGARDAGESVSAEPEPPAGAPGDGAAPPAPPAATPPPVAPPAATPTPPPGDGSARNRRVLLVGGLAAVAGAVAVAVIAGGVLSATPNESDDINGVVIPVAEVTVTKPAGASDEVAATASSTTTTTITTTTATTQPPTATATLPADLVAGIEGTGVFVAPGSTADRISLETSVANARAHGWALSVIAVPTEPDDGAPAYAASLATAMSLGTVVVVSPDGLGWASQETQFSDGEFERAWSIIPPGSSEATAVRSFVWSVLGGPDSVGLMVSSAAWLLLAADGMPSDFTYGDSGDLPLMGDWDCDGIGTVGVWRPSDGSVLLRNTADAGDADFSSSYDVEDAIPISGDFNGDGCDNVSFYHSLDGLVRVFNTPEGVIDSAEGTVDPDAVYVFGAPGDLPFVGDFDGDGVETIGLFRPSTGMVYLKNSHTAGPADIEFAFGAAGDLPIAGDWTDQDGIDSVAVYRPSTGTFFFRYTNTAGPADETLEFGVIDALPVAGAFGLDRSG